jgi:hypothetical protein
LTGFYRSFGKPIGSVFNGQALKKDLFLGCLTFEAGTDRVNETSLITYERCTTSQKAGISICKNFLAIIITVFETHIAIISPLSTAAHKYHYSNYQQAQGTLTDYFVGYELEGGVIGAS